MISVVITAFKEPGTIGKAVESFLEQDTKEEYEIIVSAPDKETQDIAKSYKGVKIFKDPGKGKSFALNLLFKELKGDIWVFTDGDVHVNENALKEIMKVFNNPKIGCVAGRPVSSNSKNSMLGYWSHLLADAGAHNIRKERFLNGDFLETSGYLFAFRNNGIVKEIPVDVAEDAIIPYYFWKKGFKIGYAEKALVFVKNPLTFKDFIKQRKRTADAHTKLTLYEPNLPKVKSFKNEITKGLRWVWSYPQNTKEFFWTGALIFTRLYMWASLFYDLKVKKKGYGDGWERVETTK